MFGKKLILIAAAVALAVTQVVAIEEAKSTHIKIHIAHSVHHKQVATPNVTESANADQAASGKGDAEAGDADDDDDADEDDDDDAEEGDVAASGKGDADVGQEETHSSGKGNAEVGDDDDDDDEEEEEQKTGSSAGKNEDATVGDEEDGDADEADEADEGEEGDEEDEEASGSAAATTAPAVVTSSTTAPAKPSAPTSAACNGKGESPMSVEGVEGIFCVTGQACVADIIGACPGKQEGLPLGAYCGKVKTGVLGCKPNTEETLKNPTKYAHAAERVVKAVDAKFNLRAHHANHKKPVVKKVEHKKVEHKKTEHHKKH